MKIIYNKNWVDGDNEITLYSVHVVNGNDVYWFNSDGQSVKASDFVQAQIGLPHMRFYSTTYGDKAVATDPITIKCFSDHAFTDDTIAADIESIRDVIQTVTCLPVRFKNEKPIHHSFSQNCIVIPASSNPTEEAPKRRRKKAES